MENPNKERKVLLKNVFSNQIGMMKAKEPQCFKEVQQILYSKRSLARPVHPLEKSEDTMQLGLMDKDSVPQNTLSLRQHIKPC